jgi:hypothetical protein
MSSPDWVIIFLVAISNFMLLTISLRMLSAFREIAETAHAHTIAVLKQEIFELRKLVIKMDHDAHEERVRYALEVSSIKPTYHSNGPTIDEL